jgi:hypothetical protein
MVTSCLETNFSLEIALTLMLALHSAFLQEFRNWESAWAMKALHTIAYDLRTIAEMVGFQYPVSLCTMR